MSRFPFIHMRFLDYTKYRRLMPEILPIQRTILSNQSIKISKAWTHQFLKYTSYLGLCNPIGFLCFVSCLFCFFVLVLCVCFYFVFFICFVFILTKLVVASVLCLQNPHFLVLLGSVIHYLA